MNNMISEMTMAQEQYKLALETNIGLGAAKERMKNIGFNYFDKLLEVLKRNAALEEEIAALNVALEDSDRELAELKKKKKAE